VFGALAGSSKIQLAAIRHERRRLFKIIAPDRNGNSVVSNEALQRLLALADQAEARVRDGSYGQTPTVPTIQIQSAQRSYDVGDVLGSGPLATWYHCRYDTRKGQNAGIFKVATSPSDNDLLAAEVAALQHLRSPERAGDEKFWPFLPEPVESFLYDDRSTGPRRVTVLAAMDGFVTLEQVREAYPHGVHPKDMAWMWRRLLYILGYVHARGVIHGAVLPPQVLIHPEGHGVVLADWCYSVIAPAQSGRHIPAIVEAYETWYPPEVFKKQSPTLSVDILMAARCMVQLVGGDPATGRLPRGVEPQLQAFFQGCMLPSPRQRPQDAWALQREFDQLIERLWGRRTFRPFDLPRR
jgi:serine/threonine protein kinase